MRAGYVGQECSHFTAWTNFPDDKTGYWSWSCSCGRRGDHLLSLDGVLAQATKDHRD